MRETLENLSRFDYGHAPPLMAMEMYAQIRERSGILDPYAEIKRHYTELAVQFLPQLKTLTRESGDAFDTALRIALAGNIIDFGAGGRDGLDVEATIRRALEAQLSIDHTHALRERLERARSVLYLCDNAGEIVLDRIFIEVIGPEKVICAVRDKPVINDATLADAHKAGLDTLCRVISSGSPAPGTPLQHCTEEFLALYHSADLVISKGQGNFETLSQADRDIFFLLIAKCPVISREIGVALGSFVVLHAGTLSRVRVLPSAPDAH